MSRSGSAPGRKEARSHQQDRSRATGQRLLDPAVDCLLEVGYSRLTTTRFPGARMSRAAPSSTASRTRKSWWRRRSTTCTSASSTTLDAAPRRLPADCDGVEEGLQILWAIYKGKSSTAALELCLAAEHYAGLREIVIPRQHALDDAIFSMLVICITRGGR